MDWTRRLCSTVLVVAVLLALVPLAAPAAATSSYLCTGYAGCAEAGYSHFGYRKASKQMWWRMYAGHNCTNYVAYRLVKRGMSAERPWSSTGMAYNWGHANRRITDQQPMVGAVAWWKRNSGGAGSSGHVAYVEEVVSARKIVISEDSWSGDFHWRTLTKGSGSWPSGFVHFDDRAVEMRTPPAVRGVPQVGAQLTASVGRWTPSARHRLQWLADGRPIAGATSATLTVPPELRGRRLSVKVEATRRGYDDGSAQSPRTPRVKKGVFVTTTGPEITGVLRVDELVQVRPGSWSPTPGTTTIQWFADGERIPGADGVELRLRQEHIGKRITVRTTARAEGYRADPETSDPTPKVAAGRFVIDGPFTLDGVPHLGRQLSVTPGSYLPADASVTYTWLRDGRAVTTGRSYPLEVPDVGARITLRVDLTHPGYRDRSLLLATAGRVTTTPEVRVTAAGKRHRAVVVVRVSAPGVDAPTGRVTVRIGRRQVVGRLEDGRLRVGLDELGAGARTVRAAYAGNGIVRAGKGSVSVEIRGD